LHFNLFSNIRLSCNSIISKEDLFLHLNHLWNVIRSYSCISSSCISKLHFQITEKFSSYISKMQKDHLLAFQTCRKIFILHLCRRSSSCISKNTYSCISEMQSSPCILKCRRIFLWIILRWAYNILSLPWLNPFISIECY